MFRKQHNKELLRKRDIYLCRFSLLLSANLFSMRFANSHLGFIIVSLNVRRWCLLCVLQMGGVNIHILYHGETHENAGMVQVIKSPTVNVAPYECYYAPDEDANRDGILQICP